MLTPSIGLLRDAVDHVRRGMPVASRIVGTMSMTWWNWLRMPPLSLIDLGPGDRHALPRAAEVRGDLLGPRERRVEGPGPRHRHVVVGLVGAPGVVEVLELVRDRHLDAVELATSFGVPISVPSALVPLSPLM